MDERSGGSALEEEKPGRIPEGIVIPKVPTHREAYILRIRDHE